MQIRIEPAPEFSEILTRLDRLEARLRDQAGTIDASRRRRARVAAVGASLRLGGLKLDDAAVAERLDAPPEDDLAEDREVRGYAAALDWEPFRRTATVRAADLRRLHAVMLGGRATEGTPWRESSIYREAFSADGIALGRIFQTLPPRLLPARIESLLDWFERESRAQRHPAPVLAGVVSLAVLAASPFPTANGRFSRLLFVGLMRRAGYDLFDVAAWEPAVESTREEYYASYDLAATHLWSGAADAGPWTSYLLRTVADAIARAERALRPRTMRARSLSTLQRSILEALAGRETMQAAHLMESTGANRNTLKDNMRKLVDAGWVEKLGERRGTRYRLLTPPSAPPLEH